MASFTRYGFPQDEELCLATHKSSIAAYGQHQIDISVAPGHLVWYVALSILQAM